MDKGKLLTEKDLKNDDRFIAVDETGFRKGEDYFLDKENHIFLKINTNNVILHLNTLNFEIKKLRNENKRLLETIEELEKLTGKSIDELIEFHMIMG